MARITVNGSAQGNVEPSVGEALQGKHIELVLTPEQIEAGRGVIVS